MDYLLFCLSPSSTTTSAVVPLMEVVLMAAVLEWTQLSYSILLFMVLKIVVSIVYTFYLLLWLLLLLSHSRLSRLYLDCDGKGKGNSIKRREGDIPLLQGYLLLSSPPPPPPSSSAYTFLEFVWENIDRQKDKVENTPLCTVEWQIIVLVFQVVAQYNSPPSLLVYWNEKRIIPQS